MASYYLMRETAEKNPVSRVYLTVTLRDLKAEQPTQGYITACDNMLTWKWKLRYLFSTGRSDVVKSSLLYTTRVEDYLDVSAVKKNIKNKLEGKVQASYVGRGYRPGQGTFKGRKSKKNDEMDTWYAGQGESQVTAEAREYLGKFASFCREHEIELIFVVMPSTKSYRQGAGDVYDFDAYLKGMAEELGAGCYNFMLYKESDSVFTNDMFKDYYHMNAKGGKVFNHLLAQILTDERPESYFM